MKGNVFQILLALLLLTGCTFHNSTKSETDPKVYSDIPFLQDYSIKYYPANPGVELMQVTCDRNGVIQILTSNGLQKPFDGKFLYPGTLVKDLTYRPMADRKIASICEYENQLVYLDDVAVLSNSWEGRLFTKHEMPFAKLFCGGRDYTFLVSDGNTVKCMRDSSIIWEGKLPGADIIDIRYQADPGLFWILCKNSLYTFSSGTKKSEQVFTGNNFTSFDIQGGNTKVVAGTSNGYIEYDIAEKKTGR